MLDSKSVYLGLNLARIATDYEKKQQLAEWTHRKNGKIQSGFLHSILTF